MTYRTISFSVQLVVCLLGLTFGPFLSACAGGIETREDALHALASPEAAQRRDATNVLARLGSQADAEPLLEALRDDDTDVRSEAETALWKLWGRSGDTSVDALLQSGIHYMNEGRMAQALEIFTRIIERKPDFAEAWNKRATAYYLTGDLDLSSKDCDEVLKRNPHHFGALSGYGLIYLRRGELESALDYFERALEINPNMNSVEESIELIRYQLRREGKEQT